MGGGGVFVSLYVWCVSVLVGHISWLRPEMTFTSTSFRISLVETNVIIELTTDYFKLMPNVPKSGGQILGQLCHRVKNESDQIYKMIV